MLHYRWKFESKMYISIGFLLLYKDQVLFSNQMHKALYVQDLLILGHSDASRLSLLHDIRRPLLVR